MDIIAILAAAAAAWIFGAIWYGLLGRPWMAAVGLTEEEIHRKNPVPYIGSFLCALIVAAMAQHILATSGLTGLLGGLHVGSGLGFFIAAPWIATNVLFQQKPLSLILIDGAYPALGLTLMGAVLALV